MSCRLETPHLAVFPQCLCKKDAFLHFLLDISRRQKRPMSAWAEQPSGGSPAGARPRPASALPLQRPCAAQAGDAGHVSEKLFWTPPKAWMLACMDKGMPLRKKKTHSSAGVAAHQHNSSKGRNDNNHISNRCHSHSCASTSCASALIIADGCCFASRQVAGCPNAGIPAAESKGFSSCEVAYALCICACLLQVQLHCGVLQAAQHLKCLHI